MSLLSRAPAFRPFTLALVQLGQIVASKPDNLRHAREMVLKAATGGASGKKPDLIVLPECFNSPYGADHFPSYAERIGYVPGKKYDIESAPSESVKMLSSAAKESGTWLIGGSIPEEEAGRLYNTCTVYSPKGDLVAIHRKVHLFDIDIPGKVTFKESQTLTGGTTTTFFDTEFARIGLGICYDIRFPELAAVAARRGCHLLVYPGAFNTTTGPLHWELLQRARAVDNQLYVSTCSPARDPNAKYQAYGHSMVVSPWGDVLCEADESESILYTDIIPPKLDEVRAHIPVTFQRRFDVYDDVSATAK